ncbi:hypothetical protein H0O03_02520 [Candidatus Micrarchaeota archaeon]|nr:hypothetical protein [Candidatus Micrarchaeota archaeon]
MTLGEILKKPVEKRTAFEQEFAEAHSAASEAMNWFRENGKKTLMGEWHKSREIKYPTEEEWKKEKEAHAKGTRAVVAALKYFLHKDGELKNSAIGEINWLASLYHPDVQAKLPQIINVHWKHASEQVGHARPIPEVTRKILSSLAAQKLAVDLEALNLTRGEKLTFSRS